MTLQATSGSRARIVVQTQVALADGAGNWVRALLFVDAEVPADPEARLPVIGSFPLYREELRSDYLSAGGAVYRLRRADNARHTSAMVPPEPRPRPEDVVARFEYRRYGADDSFWPDGLKNEHDLAVAVYGDGPPRIQGAGARSFDLTTISETVAALRAEARARLIRRPEGLYYQAPVPVIRIVHDFVSEAPFAYDVVEMDDTDEMTFSIDRGREASAFARMIAGGRPQPPFDGAMTTNPDLLPLRDDVVGLASALGPELARLRFFDPPSMDRETLLAWHDAANAERIATTLGRSGAERVLSGLRRLIGYLHEIDAIVECAPRFRERLARIAARIDLEVPLIPSANPAEPRP